MNPHLYHFIPAEFREWYPVISTRLLVLLDVLRYRWGHAITISANPRALGRHDGPSLSQHNIDRWGEVRAADVFPKSLFKRDDAQRIILLAKEVGFTGIGLYPHWDQGVGMHLDVRHDRKPGQPAVWGMLPATGAGGEPGQKEVSLTQAINELPESTA